MLTPPTRIGLTLEIDGVRRRFTVATSGEAAFVHTARSAPAELTLLPRFPAAEREEVAGGCVRAHDRASIRAGAGRGRRPRREGQVLLVLEAMKMEHQMIAARPPAW